MDIIVGIIIALVILVAIIVVYMCGKQMEDKKDAKTENRENDQTYKINEENLESETANNDKRKNSYSTPDLDGLSDEEVLNKMDEVVKFQHSGKWL